MFERYTEKARRVIFYARYEASQFGSPEIGSEFLLLGIMREDPYVVTRWLNDETDWQEFFHKEAEKYLGKKPVSSTSIDLPLSSEAKRVLSNAEKEAGRLANQHIDTEHLFLGLLRDPKSYVCKMLHKLGVNEDTVRETFATEAGLHTLSQRLPRISIIIEGASKMVQLSWPSRVPAIGEFLSLVHVGDESTLYQVTKVEWKVATTPPFLSEAVIHVRELPQD